VTLYLRAADGRDFAIIKGPIGLGIKPGSTGSESWLIRAPASIPKGSYRAYLLFHDNHESSFPDQSRFEKRSFDLGELELR